MWKCTVYYDSLNASCCCIHALLWVFSVFTAYCFTICHPTCCSANRSAFSGSLAGQTLSGNLISAELANSYLDCQKLDTIFCEPYSYYASASVPKWPRNKLESIKFAKKISGEAWPHADTLVFMLMHADIYIAHQVTTSLKFQATDLQRVMKSVCVRAATKFVEWEWL